ncbi:branched-chain amino acid ABC transporter permease [Pseudonocardia sp.]|jgi:branched-chain amino acid transport system permease protein|uniref:branched-chain amino acid ABC transporter permease n=1 Tax=Pseudonocardia sp. TaxID=60912 RepID=UPI003D11CC76
MSSELFFQAMVNGLMLAALYALVALGLTLIFGLLDVVNFAHGQLILLGAYVLSSIVDIGASFWVALPIVVAGLVVLGVVLDMALFARVRDEPINGLLISLGLVAILENAFHVIYGPDLRRVPAPIDAVIDIAGVRISGNRLLVIVVTVVVLVALSYFLRRTRTGKAMRATAEADEAAGLMGIRVERIRHIAFAAGAGLAGLAGVLMATVYPIEPSLGEGPLIMGFAALILGGSRSPLGAVLGAVVIGTVQSFGTTYLSSSLADVLVFAFLILILFWRPQGLLRARLETAL